MTSKTPQSTRTVTAILTGSLPLPLTPENISTIALYQVHANLWDTLLSQNGSPGLATLVETGDSGRLLRFEIGRDARFSNGRKIESEDVAFSLRRLMTRQEGGHFNARAAIADIRVLDESRFELVLHDPTPALQLLLSIPETGIVPKEACDEKGNVVNLSVTSGPYVVDGIPTNDRITLAKNPYFKRGDASSPDRITLLLSHGELDPVSLMRSGQADFLECYDGSGVNAFEALKGNPEIDFRVTRPSYSIFLTVKSDHLALSQRQSIAQVIRGALHSHYAIHADVEKWSNEVLPPGTFGSLEKTYSPAILSQLDLPKRVRFGTTAKPSAIEAAVISILSSSGVSVEQVPYGSPESDLFLRGHGMNSDFPEIEFYLSMLSPYAKTRPTDRERSLVMQALHSGDLAFRESAIREIGRGLLEDARAIPLIVRSYAHVFRKDRVNADAMTTYDGDVRFAYLRLGGSKP